MHTKTTYFGQHFHLSIIKNGNDTTLILSNSDETNNKVVFTDKHELMEIADFIHNTLQMNVAKQVMVEDSESLRNLSK
jgi:hypothetical protein